MKKVALIILLAGIVLLAGCKQQAAQQPQVSTSTIEVTTSSISAAELTKKVSGFDTETCPSSYLRKKISADGSIEYYCVEPSYFRLKQCTTTADCDEVEECRNGYCYIIDEDIIA